MTLKIHNWLANFVDIAEALVAILTCNIYAPNWSMKYRVWFVKQEIVKRRNTHDNLAA